MMVTIIQDNTEMEIRRVGTLNLLKWASGFIGGGDYSKKIDSTSVDLPNCSQRSVPIFSLPQEWLWCESSCGNAIKSKAKTMDLWNNPMTKEPNLQGAKKCCRVARS